MSTQEVGNLICLEDSIADCTVYAVSIPGMDGKCGMAAVVLKPGLEHTEGMYHLPRHLPANFIESVV